MEHLTTFATLMGTKRDLAAGAGTAAENGGNGVWMFLQTLFALAVVYLALKYLLPKFASKLNKRLATNLGSEIHIEESAAFAGGALYLVSVRGKNLLLSVTGQNVACLAEVPARQAIDEPTFDEFLHDAGHGDADPNSSELLRRLARLGGNG